MDLGSIGRTWKIIEPDLARRIQQRAAEMAKPGWQKARRLRAQSQAVAYMRNPPGIELPAARVSKERQVAIEVPAENKELFSWQGRLLFINADDVAQRRWFERKLLPGIGDKPGNKLRVVLVQGEPATWSEHWQIAVYFDQRGQLSQKLGIEALPALLSWRQGQLLLQQVAVPR